MFSNKKRIWSVFCAFVSLFILTAGALKLTVFAQTAENVKSVDVRPRTTINKTVSTESIAFRAAAAENTKLKTSLAWTFGSKTQTGWYLYETLIQHTLKTESAAETPEFASAISAWQKKNALAPNGVIDEETLLSFVKYWQSRRLNSSIYPTDDKVFTAPISFFYDPTRSVELLKVEREAFEAYKRMIAAAAADKSLNLKVNKSGEFAPEEKFLKIVSAFRSREYQEKLRAKSPQSGSAGLATNSPHFTGQALDIYVGGEPVSTKDFNRAIQVQTPVYKWLVKNAERFGFYPYYYEPWHWEYVPRNLNK
ncbi:MAG TPA: D-alanyl-D-alanine carboxypeptidase family protein [Pyrinomonadaceae bacterium]|nr:D-alanyl-D-alanine carboxypeptidase family protein [Pyrinomonadaceae bacterium]